MTRHGQHRSVRVQLRPARPSTSSSSMYRTRPYLRQPAISSTGHLSFTPAIDWHGSSTVTVHLHDDGGLEDWGVAGVSPQTRAQA